MKKMAIYGLTGLLGLVFVGSGVMKLVAPPPVVEGFTKFGLLAWLRPIGVLELLCVGLFLFPKTRIAGTLLLCSYLGGAIVAHMSRGEPFIFPAAILALIWVVTYLRNPGFFASET